MPRYPHVFVPVSDGKPIDEIIERVETAMKRAGISSAKRSKFLDSPMMLSRGSPPRFQAIHRPAKLKRQDHLKRSSVRRTLGAEISKRR